RDRLGNVIDEARELRPATNGEDVVLSVDSDLQFVVVNQLKQAIKKHRAKAAAAIVLDAKTGEVLAMANLPTYDPNDRSSLRGANLRNRVFTDMFEPGSTLKPFTVALGLDRGLIRPLTKIDTGKGQLKIGPAVISDTEAKGVMTVEQVIEKSSNVGTSKIALELESKDMWQFFYQLGFGQAPDVGFPGAAAGLVRPWNKWRPIEQATMSYGHGISVSLVQLAQAYTVFANEGRLIPVSLVRKSGKNDIEGREVISAQTARQMLRMLEMAAGPEGTAPLAQVQGFSVAGKTGTAHKQANGRYINKYVSSFVGLAPVSKPRIIVAVMVDEPNAGQYYGGLVAAPIFSAIARNAMGRLGVEPDQLDRPRNYVSVKKGVAL
ncbi:MAG: penicillin-binding protein 2, partial [Limnobacter sp.]|nr:penicillin-binding protein 2 [Limnobacter sp.]